ncbi:MAG TPA: molybdenum cofactor guanylyltransferase [Nitrospirales bacterium]|nr:molybdenum cofactor guanylyltransferase [Nitrospirales bacterium]
MGRDKRHLDVGGVGLLARVAEILGTVCGEVLIVTAEPEPHLHVGSGRLVTDEIPGKGTLGGIYTGLLHAAGPRALVVACDMPFLNAELLRWLADRDPAADVLMPRLATGLQPTHAIYSKRCVDPLKRLLDAGEMKAQSLASHSGLAVTVINESDVRPHDPDLLSFLNLNTPADLEMARKLLAQRRSS